MATVVEQRRRAIGSPEGSIEVPSGLDGVTVADTSVGDVRGAEGFYHYREYSAVDLARSRSFEDVWHLLLEGRLPDRTEAESFARRAAEQRTMPEGLAGLLPEIALRSGAMEALRTSVSELGGELGWAPVHDLEAAAVAAQAVRLVAVTPTVLAAAYRIGRGQEPVPPRADLGHAANYLWMLTGDEPSPEHARALEQYLVLTVDHGFNASTFAARVIASTGADLASAVCGAVGALAGPLHGGAPSRALDMLDAVRATGDPRQWVRQALDRGERIMGFGHRVYRTDDPRAVFLRELVLRLGGELAQEAVGVEESVVEALTELKPGRHLYTNVEFYAGIVMTTCGVSRDMFTPTFASSRMVGWCAHVLEQAGANRLIRPLARYVGPPPPAPVPAP